MRLEGLAFILRGIYLENAALNAEWSWVGPPPIISMLLLARCESGRSRFRSESHLHQSIDCLPVK
jgi:hypothetical protein